MLKEKGGHFFAAQSESRISAPFFASKTLIILMEIKKSKYNFKKYEKSQLKSLALKYIFSLSQSIWKYRKTAF
jgi:hypothetical protein